MKTQFIKSICFFCTLFLGILALVACEEAPKRESDSQNEISQLSSPQYVTLEEAKKQTEQLAGNHIEGVYFPESIYMPDISTLSLVQLKPWFSKKGDAQKKVLQKVWKDYDKVDWSKIEEKRLDTKENNYFAGQKVDEQTGFLYSYDSVGFFSGDSLNDSEIMSDACVKKYDFGWGDTAGDDAYKMEDGEIKVKDAVEYAENVLNENLSSLEKDEFVYKVQHLYVVQHDGEDYYDYNMVIGRVYKDVMLETCSDFFLPEGNGYDNIHSGAHFIVVMRNKNNLNYITICEELFTIEQVTEQNEIISPIWATEQLNHEIAHANGMRISKCGLVYVLVQKNKLEKDNAQAVYQGVNSKTTYMRPVWLFATEGSGGMFQTLTEDLYGNSVVVDAIDGTLYYYESTGAY